MVSPLPHRRGIAELMLKYDGHPGGKLIAAQENWFPLPGVPAWICACDPEQEILFFIGTPAPNDITPHVPAALNCGATLIVSGNTPRFRTTNNLYGTFSVVQRCAGTAPRNRQSDSTDNYWPNRLHVYPPGGSIEHPMQALPRALIERAAVRSLRAVANWLPGVVFHTSQQKKNPANFVSWQGYFGCGGRI